MSGVVIAKNSRMPRKAGSPQQPRKDYSVTKRPMGTIPAERRAEIADEVLKRYMLGEQVAAIAPDFKTSDVTIYALLLREREQEWADIQKARALARYERALNELENAQAFLEAAPDALSLARARETLRFAESRVKASQWELERLLRRLYGQDHNVNVNLNVTDLGDRLRRAKGRVIDVSPAPQIAAQHEPEGAL
jgi:hypothetical protein